MAEVAAPHRWSVEEYVDAWEAGELGERRVELVEGEIWRVKMGSWHGRTTARVVHLLMKAGMDATMESLVSGPQSMTDPDVWVPAQGAKYVTRLSKRIGRYDPADVLLVVEVGDTTLQQDLTVKTRVYGSAGFPVYWVVSPAGVYVHTTPHSDGYRERVPYITGDSVPLPWSDEVISVEQLIAGPS